MSGTYAMGMKDSIRDSGMYHRLKASVLYDWYWRFVDRRVIEARDREIAFYRGLLGDLAPGTLIFDVGANHGYKTDIFLRLGASVVAVDPDSKNQGVLRRRFHAYRLKRRPVRIVGKAVSDSTGRMTLWIDAPGSAKNTLSQKWVSTLRTDTERFGEHLEFRQQQQVETVTVADLVAEHGRPWFIKIDVEGHEPSVIAGMSEAVPFVSFEVNLPEFVDEGVECVRGLHRLDEAVEFNITGTDLGRGFLLPSWVEASEMERLLRTTSERSVEVFARTIRAAEQSRSLRK